MTNENQQTSNSSNILDNSSSSSTIEASKNIVYVLNNQNSQVIKLTRPASMLQANNAPNFNNMKLEHCKNVTLLKKETDSSIQNDLKVCTIQSNPIITSEDNDCQQTSNLMADNSHFNKSKSKELVKITPIASTCQAKMNSLMNSTTNIQMALNAPLLTAEKPDFNTNQQLQSYEALKQQMSVKKTQINLFSSNQPSMIYIAPNNSSMNEY